MQNPPTPSGVSTSFEDGIPRIHLTSVQPAPTPMTQDVVQGSSAGPALMVRSSLPALTRAYPNSMQSIDAVLHQPDQYQHGGFLHPTYRPNSLSEQNSARSVTRTSDYGASDDDENRFGAFDRLMEDYETACDHGDFLTLLALPPPADPDDVWSEIEDVSIRSQQWGYLQQLMEKFDKQFDTDFMAEIVSSGYEDSHKACVVDLAVKCGWDINSPKSDGNYILCNALDNETDEILGFLLSRGANPNLFLDGLELDIEDPITTPTGLPLQEALQHGSVEQVHILLQFGASPDMSNAVHAAIRSDQDEVQKIKLLLDYRANKNALEWAGNPVMTALLQQNEIRQVAAIALAYDLNKSHVVQFLFDTSIDPAAFPSRGKVLPGIRRSREHKRQKEGRRMNDSKAPFLGKTGRTSSLTRSSLGKSSAGSPSHVSKTKRSINVKRHVRMYGRSRTNRV